MSDVSDKPSAAVVLFVRRPPIGNATILAVTNRAYGGMALPGGKVEIGEDIRRTAMREIREETGIVILATDLTLIAKGLSVRPMAKREVHMFFARHAWGTPQDIEEGTHHAWITLSELLDVSPFKAFYEHHLPDGILHLRATVFADISVAPPDPNSARIVESSDLLPAPTRRSVR